MSDELLRVLNEPVDDESALARMWEEYAMSEVDESSDSHTLTVTVTARSGWQLGTDGVQSDDKFDMLASDRYVEIEQAVFLLECLIQEKDDSLKASSFRFVSFVRVTHYPTYPGPRRGGGGTVPCIVVQLALLVAVLK